MFIDLFKIYKKGSTLISMAEQGRVRSKAVMTSGWRTPRVPTTWP